MLLSFQIVYGAFMAGTRAGYLYDTFPDMNGQLWVGGRALADFVSDPVTIHGVHRTLAWAVTAWGLYLAWRLRDTGPGRWLAALLVTQVALGAATVLSAVGVALAVAHQLGAWALLTAAVVCLHAHRARPGARGAAGRARPESPGRNPEAA